MKKRLTGLIAATFTPMRADGELNLDMVVPTVKHLLNWNIGGLYVTGSTGEGVSLTSEERRTVVEAFVSAVNGRVPVIVQVGHNSLAEARQLAAHAEQAGVAAVSAVPPSYFKIDSVETLVACMSEIANAAPSTPFYYYHIPHLSGVSLNVVEFLRIAGEKISTFCGIKYTAPTIDELQACLKFRNRKFDVLHGRDEMLLSGLCAGAVGTVGSTFNFAAPIYFHLIEAFSQGDMEAARMWQDRAIEMIHLILRYKGLAGQKAVMKLIGLDHGPIRLPLSTLTDSETETLRQEIDEIGFFDWIRPSAMPEEGKKPHFLQNCAHINDGQAVQ